MSFQKVALILGAGPAGLSAACALIEQNIKPIIVETESVIGGLSRTLNYNGNIVDIGPHRFFTKEEKILNLWEKFLPKQGFPAKDDIQLKRDVSFFDGTSNPEIEDKSMLKRYKISRILYDKNFYDYPIKLNINTFKNLGLKDSLIAFSSYLKSCIFKSKEKSLQDFIINRYGKFLYKMFFENHTQKVWGHHPQNIPQEWGVQRIKGISFVKDFFKNPLSLTDEYLYPKNGSSQLWDEMAQHILNCGGEIHTNATVVGLKLENKKIVSVQVNKENQTHDWYADYIISSLPIKDLMEKMSSVPQSIKNVATNLAYRDYIMTTFLIKDFKIKNNTKYPTLNNIPPDSWIYTQQRDVKVGRLYTPQSFSPYICDTKNTVVCLEYFCNENDELWNKSQEDFIKFSGEELKKIGIIEDSSDILEAYQFKTKKAYPAHFGAYKDFDKIKDFINLIDNLYPIGRNGQHKYNNIDHSMLSGILASEIITKNLPKEYIWDVNTEKIYNEIKNN